MKQVLRWGPKSVALSFIAPSKNNDEETRKRLEAVTGALYDYFSQLVLEIDQVAPKTTEPRSPTLGRTGTDG